MVSPDPRSGHSRVPVATITSMALALLVAAGGPPVMGATRTPMSTNLIRNGGAESGPSSYPESVVGKVPYWRRSERFTVTLYGIAGFLSKRESRRIGGGDQHFACGFISTLGLARQRIRLRGIGGAVDAGRIRASVEAKISAPGGGGDRGRLVVRFLDVELREVGSGASRWVAGTTRRYATRGISKTLPRGTRYVQVILRGERRAGLYCNVFFDKVSLRLSRS